MTCAVMYTQATKLYPVVVVVYPPPRQTSHNQYKPVRTGLHQLCLDLTGSHYVIPPAIT